MCLPHAVLGLEGFFFIWAAFGRFLLIWVGSDSFFLIGSAWVAFGMALLDLGRPEPRWRDFCWQGLERPAYPKRGCL